MVVKPEKAKSLVAAHEIDAQLTFKSEEGFTVWRTPGFATLLGN
jgi:hypothetical protein